MLCCNAFGAHLGGSLYAQGGQKVLPEREVLVTDDNGGVVARMHKTLDGL